MSSIFGLVYWLLNLFLIALIGRLILDYIRIFSPNFRPRGYRDWETDRKSVV